MEKKTIILSQAQRTVKILKIVRMAEKNPELKKLLDEKIEEAKSKLLK